MSQEQCVKRRGVAGTKQIAVGWGGTGFGEVENPAVDLPHNAWQLKGAGGWIFFFFLGWEGLGPGLEKSAEGERNRIRSEGDSLDETRDTSS